MSNLKNIIASGWYLTRPLRRVIARIFGTKTDATVSGLSAIMLKSLMAPAEASRNSNAVSTRPGLNSWTPMLVFPAAFSSLDRKYVSSATPLFDALCDTDDRENIAPVEEKPILKI